MCIMNFRYSEEMNDNVWKICCIYYKCKGNKEYVYGIFGIGCVFIKFKFDG